MNSTLMKALNAPFPEPLIKHRDVGGSGEYARKVSYVAGSNVIRRLNEVFGHEWTYVVKDREIDYTADHIAVLGQLTIKVPETSVQVIEEKVGDVVTTRTISTTHEVEIIKEQWGGSQIMRKRSTSNIISLGDDLKKASTDAMKKCATLFGVALDLYDSDDSPETTFVDEPVELTQEEKDRLAANVQKVATLAQVNTIKNTLKSKGRTQKDLIKFLEVEKWSEVPFSDAQRIINGEHLFWRTKM